MNQNSGKWMPVFAVLILLAGTLAAQTTEQYVDTKHSVILNQLIAGKGFKNKAVQMMVVDFPPMSRSPSHRHPCPTFGYVISGEIISVFEGKTHHYKAGDSFYETPNGLHSDARNDSQKSPAKLLVIYVKDNEKPTFTIATH